MSNFKFRSKLAEYMEGLLQERLINGFTIGYLEPHLRDFDSFIINNGFNDGTLSRELTDKWSIQRSTENLNSRNSRVSYVRALARYMISIGKDAFLPKVVGSNEHSRPYIPTREELQTFFRVVDHDKPHINDLKNIHCCYPVLFRMYYCLGLRRTEAAMLKRNDVSFETGTLYIRHSKGDKDRIVYASEDLVELMERLDTKLERLCPNREWFFPGASPGSHINGQHLSSKFKRYWEKAFPNWTGKRPTLHTLRHCYVVHAVNNWVEAGNDADILFPYLSKSLGHSTIQDTMYYYHMWDSETGAMDRFIKTPSILIENKEEWI